MAFSLPGPFFLLRHFCNSTTPDERARTVANLTRENSVPQPLYGSPLFQIQAIPNYFTRSWCFFTDGIMTDVYSFKRNEADQAPMFSVSQ